MEKAKYIQNKEATLYNDLDKAHKKIKEIANWYFLSDYDTTFIDEKNQKLYIQKVNNIYYDMKNLLMAMGNMELFRDYEDVITKEKINSLEELEEFLINIRGNKE